MVQYNKEIVKQHLEALDYPSIVIELRIDHFGKIHDALQECFDEWLEGNEIDFEFEGISLFEIMKRGRYDYLHALSMMTGFIKEPEEIPMFKSIPEFILQRRCGGAGGKSL